MRTKRNTTRLVIIALMAGLGATGWSVMADVVPAPVIVPGGIYTGALNSPAGPFTVSISVIPMDPAGNKMICIADADNSDPTWGAQNPPSSETDHQTDFALNMVRTGPDTWDYTGIAYGTRKVEGQLLPEMVYMTVNYGTLTSTEDGKVLITKGNSAYYWADQDVDGDGFPDADQEPFYCVPFDPEAEGSPWMRVPLLPPCVPAPLPGG